MNRIAHENQKVGLASAMAVVLLAIIMLVTIVQKLLFAYVFNDEKDMTKRKRKLVKREG